MTEPSPVLVAIRQLLASAQDLLDGLLRDGSAEPAREAAPARRGRPRGPVPSAQAEPRSASGEAQPPTAARRRRNPAAGRAAKARWEAMTPEERAARVHKMQSARKRATS